MQRFKGPLTDPTGAVLSGAKLTATNVGTNLPYTAETSGDGNYVFLNLPIGTYRVTATKFGLSDLHGDRHYSWFLTKFTS